MSKSKILIFLLLILALAGFLRLWQIDGIPPGLYPDEAMNGNDALTSQGWPVFYPENNGREGLFIWLMAISFKIFGPAVWSLRLVSALIGILTVLGLYLLTKQLYNPKIALLASFFLAVSFWHINFSRIGFRAILVPFCLVFSFYFLFKALENRKLLNFILAGLFFGLGFYTYIAFRAALLILGILMCLEIWFYWPKFKVRITNKDLRFKNLFKEIYIHDGWWRWDVFFLVIILVALPLGIYFIQNPQDFIGRAGGVSIFATEEPLKEFGLSALKSLGMFNFAGDWNWRHNYAGSSMLVWSVGILFVLGLVLVMKNIVIGAWQCGFWNVGGASGHGSERLPTGRREESERSPRVSKPRWGLRTFPEGILPSSVFLLSWFFIMLLPAVFTAEGLPHALRSIGVIPVVYIFAALGLYWLVSKMWRINKKVAVLLLILFLFQPLISNFNKYFFQWAQNPHVAGAFRQDLVKIADYLNSLPPDTQKYVIVNEPGVPVPFPDGIPMPSQTIQFITYQKSEITYLKLEFILEQLQEAPLGAAPKIIVPLQYDQNIFDQLEQKWPDGQIEKKDGFTVYTI